MKMKIPLFCLPVCTCSIYYLSHTGGLVRCQREPYWPPPLFHLSSHDIKNAFLVFALGSHSSGQRGCRSNQEQNVICALACRCSFFFLLLFPLVFVSWFFFSIYFFFFFIHVVRVVKYIYMDRKYYFLGGKSIQWIPRLEASMWYAKTLLLYY